MKIDINELDREAIAPRFWSKVNKAGEDECWLWTASLDHAGYGWFGLGGRRGQMHHAQRVAWWLTTGQWPGPLFVCHTCDNRRCVNPSHLFLGTNQDNVSDMVRKQRQSRGESKSKALKAALPRGEQHHNSKLTDDDIIKIREAYARGNTSMNKLANEYGVTFTNINAIIHRRYWPHVQPEQEIPVVIKNGAKLNESDVLEIRNLARQGLTQQEIASRFNISRKNVSAIVNRLTWKHI